MQCGLRPREAHLLLQDPAIDGYASSAEARERIKQLREGLGMSGSSTVLRKSPSDLTRNLDKIRARVVALSKSARMDHDDAKSVIAHSMPVLDLSDERFSAILKRSEEFLPSHLVRNNFLQSYPDFLMLPPERLVNLDWKRSSRKTDLVSLWEACVAAGKTGEEEILPRAEERLPPDLVRRPTPRPVPLHEEPATPLQPLSPDDADCRIVFPPMSRAAKPTELGSLETLVLYEETIRMIRSFLEMDIDMVTNLVRFRPWLVERREKIARLFRDLLRLKASRDQLFELLTSNAGLVAQGVAPITHVMNWLMRNRVVRLPDDLGNLAIPEDLFWNRLHTLSERKILPPDPCFRKALFARTQRGFKAALNPLKLA
jgi:hypothetical protein